jgi:hypothetical protein
VLKICAGKLQIFSTQSTNFQHPERILPKQFPLNSQIFSTHFVSFSH